MINNELVHGKKYKIVWVDGDGKVNECVFKFKNLTPDGKYEIEQSGESSVIASPNAICHPWTFSSFEMVD